MRITFISPPFDLSGGQRVIATYAERLRRRGHDVVVVTLPPRRPRAGEIVRSLLRGRGWPEPPERSPSHFDRIDVECRVIDSYRPIINADVPDADVIIATWWETAEWVAALSPRKGAKAYFIQHHEVFPYLPIDRVEATWRLPLHKVTISQWLVRLAQERYGDDHVSLVPNSVDHAQFYAPQRGKNIIPTVGLLYATAPFKGCDVSLRVFTLCAERLPGLRLVAFGAQPIAPQLPLPAGAEYHFQPAQHTLRTLYAQCDAWLCGSRCEGFHLPPLEAMACRCPVVSTRVGGPMELIEDGVNGFLVDVEDVAALSGRLVEVLSMPEPVWRRMSDAAYATALRYTWDDATDRFESALQAAVERSVHGVLSARLT